MALLDIYLETHPGFLQRIEKLGTINAKKFFKKLNSGNDVENFNTTISEFLFCEFFNDSGYQVHYEKTYKGSNLNRDYEPDITLSQIGKNILVEVFKLNPIQSEIDRQKFFQFFFEKRVYLTYSYNIEICLNDEVINPLAYNKEQILADLDLWLSLKRSSGDKYIVDEYLEFTIVCETKHSNVGFKYKANIKFDKKRILSALRKKVYQHITLLKETRLPFFICMKTDLEAAINEPDLFYALYGDLTANIDLHIFKSELNGLFYEDACAREYLSGVLLMVNSTVFFFRSFSNTTFDAENNKMILLHQFFLNELYPSRVEYYERVRIN